jgi:hypothetical protein
MSNCAESCDKLIETLENKCQRLAREKGEMRIEIQRLKRELEYFETGHKGACPTCERVGELNVEVSQEIAQITAELETQAIELQTKANRLKKLI